MGIGREHHGLYTASTTYPGAGVEEGVQCTGLKFREEVQAAGRKLSEWPRPLLSSPRDVILSN